MVVPVPIRLSEYPDLIKICESPVKNVQGNPPVEGVDIGRSAQQSLPEDESKDDVDSRHRPEHGLQD